jgi:hypothetical protein
MLLMTLPASPAYAWTDAASYAPPRPPGTKGRPRKTGARLPNLSAVLSDAKTVWQRVTMPQWYGEGERCIELTV